MDALIPLLLMLALYLLPELLKKRKGPKKYEYPDIADKEPQPIDIKPAKVTFKHVPQFTVESVVEGQKTWASPPQPAVSMPVEVTAPPTAGPASPWQGKLSPQTMQNGLVFSEIIRPPRAYRPIWRKSK